jgi:hypothetical protein
VSSESSSLSSSRDGGGQPLCSTSCLLFAVPLSDAIRPQPLVLQLLKPLLKWHVSETCILTGPVGDPLCLDFRSASLSEGCRPALVEGLNSPASANRPPSQLRPLPDVVLSFCPLLRGERCAAGGGRRQYGVGGDEGGRGAASATTGTPERGRNRCNRQPRAVRSPKGWQTRRQPRKNAIRDTRRARRRPIYFFAHATEHTARWSSPVAREAHNLEVAGSNPARATHKPPQLTSSRGFFVALVIHRLAHPVPAAARHVARRSGRMLTLSFRRRIHWMKTERPPPCSLGVPIVCPAGMERDRALKGCILSVNRCVPEAPRPLRRAPVARAQALRARRGR